MSKIDHLIKLADKFELLLKKAKEDEGLESKKLLEAAMKANKGHGMQIYFKGQHFGWYKWDAKNKEHKQFSIGNYKPEDKIGELEEDLSKCPRVNLEDFLPTIAGRKQI
jgi:hypothetical protein